LDTLGRKTVTILARDVIQAGCEGAALRALDQLVAAEHRPLLASAGNNPFANVERLSMQAGVTRLA